MPQENNFDNEAELTLKLEGNKTLKDIDTNTEANLIETSGVKKAVEGLEPILEGVLLRSDSLEKETKNISNSKTKNNELLNKIADNTEQEEVKVIDIVNNDNELAGKFFSLLKGDKGDKGDKPTSDELMDIIKPLIPKDDDLLKVILPLIPEPKKGQDGKDYKLTDNDIKKIASSIDVPVVENTKTIIERPIIKEVAVKDNPKELKKKLLEEGLYYKELKGLPDLYKVFGTSTFIGLTDTPSTYSGQAGKFAKVKATEDGLEFDSGGGGGTGDMLKATYDPQNIEDDAFDRANHTGQQAISTITNLQDALDDKYDASNPDGFISVETDPVFSVSQAFNITSQHITDLSNLSGINTGDQDLSSFITGAEVPANETDPIFTASQAFNIDATDITNLSNLSGVNTGDQSAGSFNHNDLANKQGGTAGEFYHLTSAQHTVVGNTSGTNTGDNANNTQYANDYRLANFVAGTDYLAPTGNGSGLTGLTKGQVGLGNVDNTSDASKPVSTAQQTALDLKANLISPTFATSITGSYLTASEILITDASKNIVSAPVATYPSLTELTYLKGVTSAIQTQIDSKGSGTVTSVSGTTNRITSTGGATPVINISATFEGLLGKVANPLSQFAATTSAELAGVISDETGSGLLVFGTSPTFITDITTPLIYGSASSGGTLTLASTTHATKGKILFGTSAYDEVNDRLGIGINTPTSKLHVVGSLGSLSAQGDGAYINIATTAQADNNTRVGLRVDLTSGYVGSGGTISLSFLNSVAGTAKNLISTAGNIGISGNSNATTTGYNFGLAGFSRDGDINIGTYGRSFIAKNSAVNIGAFGLARNTGASGIEVGGFFGLYASGASAPTFTSAALMADNGVTTSDIFVARDGGTAVMTIIDGGNVGIGVATPNANAILDVTSTTKAFMPPRMTSTQRDAISSPTAGMLIYNSTTGAINFYNGAWTAGAGSGDMVLADTQTNTGAKTFNDNTLLLRNVANTFNGKFTNTVTAARTYTLPDYSGTVGLWDVDLTLAADFEVSNAGLTDVTGMSFTVGANEAWYVELIYANSANNTTGDIIQDLVATVATFTTTTCFTQGVIYGATGTLTTRAATAFSSTTSAQGSLVVNNGDGVIRNVRLYYNFTTTAAATIKLQQGHAAGAGRTSTIYAGAKLRAMRYR
jgi:hypothetical protein